MRYEDLGPVTNPDGSPSDLTIAMLAGTGRDPDVMTCPVHDDGTLFPDDAEPGRWAVDVHPWDTDPGALTYHFETREEAERFIGLIPEEDHVFLSGGNGLVAYQIGRAMTAGEAMKDLGEHYYMDLDDEKHGTATDLQVHLLDAAMPISAPPVIDTFGPQGPKEA